MFKVLACHCLGEFGPKIGLNKHKQTFILIRQQIQVAEANKDLRKTEGLNTYQVIGE